MDSDCLIKFTKAGLKGLVADKNVVIIPDIVRQEAVAAGKTKGCGNALVVEKNIQARKISLQEASQLFNLALSQSIDLFAGMGIK